MNKFREFEKIIGYEFKNKLLLKRAFSHSSYINEEHLKKSECNERLEFLGDAVLELVTSEFLFNRDSEMQEGELTKLRASIVCEPSLSYIARELKMPKFLILGNGEDMTGGRERDSNLSNALEAVIGAIYVDGGLTNAKEFIERFIVNDLDNRKLFFDSKTIFQEIVQGENLGTLSYKLLKETGPAHSKNFKVAVFINDVEYGVGVGSSKKGAEQVAAYNAILKLKEGNKV